MPAKYCSEHRVFAQSFATFLSRHVADVYADWELAGITPRDIFQAAGRDGFLGMDVPEDFGGAGVDDFRFNAVILDELAKRGYGSLSSGFSMHNDICVPYFLSHTTEEQKQRWLPGIVAGDLIAGIGMTEPGTGSDLAAIATVADGRATTSSSTARRRSSRMA